MTNISTARCSWCGRSFRPSSAKGPWPKYCSQAHRQRAYEARRQTRLAREVADHLNSLGLREQLTEFANPSVQSRLQEQLAAFAEIQQHSRLREQLTEFANPSFQSRLQEQLAAFANPSFQSWFQEQLSALVGEGPGSRFREQLEALAVVGDWDLDVEDIEEALAQLDEAAKASEAAGDEGTYDEVDLPLGSIAVALLTIVIAHPDLRAGLVVLGQDSIKTIGFLLALIEGIETSSAEFRGFIIVINIVACVTAILRAWKSGPGNGSDP